MLYDTSAALAAAEIMVAGWQSSLGNDITVVLSGSLPSRLCAWDEHTKVIDVDLRFLVNDDQILNHSMHDRIEAATGLTLRKRLRIGTRPDSDEPVSDVVLFEGQFLIPGIDVPLEVEGCLRNRRYVSWAYLYAQVFTDQERLEILKTKSSLRRFGTKENYKAYKSRLRQEADRRVVMFNLAERPDPMMAVA